MRRRAVVLLITTVATTWPARVTHKSPAALEVILEAPARAQTCTPSYRGEYHPQQIATAIRDDLRRKDVCSARADADLLVSQMSFGLLPYPFPFDYGFAGRLRPPWFSGLAQAQAAGALHALFRSGGGSAYERAARRAFAATRRFLFPQGWVQEYQTDVPSFVLNGHILSILEARAFDPGIFVRGVDAVRLLLPLFDVAVPGGHVGAYDLVRRATGAPLRVTGNTRVRSSVNFAAPRYPTSVLAVPRAVIHLTYAGHGLVQVRDDDRWLTLATLTSTAHTADVVVPERFTGRFLSRHYNALEARLLRRLFELTGDEGFERWARRWASA